MKSYLFAAVLAGTAGVAIAQTPGVAPMAAPAAAQRMMQMPDTRDGVVAMVRDHFARADANRDGFVAGDEMRGMRAERKERRMAMRGAAPRANPAAMFERLDSNRDNMISRDEFERGQAMRAERRTERRDERLERRGQRMAMRGHARMMRRADADRDGRVSIAEAQAAALRHFDRVDANRDGRITPDERQQMRQHRLQRRAPRAG